METEQSEPEHTQEVNFVSKFTSSVDVCEEGVSTTKDIEVGKFFKGKKVVGISSGGRLVSQNRKFAEFAT